MGTRQQQAGRIAPSSRTRAGGVRPVYEDFRPISEWKQVEDDNILLVYLPGFTKEQIRVSTEAGSTIRIQGEHLVGGNKWSRFEEDFRIPQDCNVKGIRAKFDAGILTITIPTNTTTITRPSTESHRVGHKEEAKPTTTPIPQQAPAPAPSSQDYVTPTTTTTDKSPPRQEKKVQEEDIFPITRTDGTMNMNNKKGSLQHGLIPKSTFKFRERKQADDGKGIEKTTTTEPKSWEDQDGTSPPKGKGSISGTVGVEKQPDHGKGVVGSTSGLIDAKIVEGSEGKGKPTEVKMPEISDQKKGTKEPILKSENEVKKTAEKDKFEGTTSGGANDEKAKDYYYSSDVAKQNQATGVSELDKYKQAIKGIIGQRGHLNEETQLVLNMGIAVLVIVALGAYISYTLGTRKR